MLWLIIGGCLANGIDGAKFSFLLLCFYRTKWDKMWCEGGVAGYAVILYSIQFSMCQDFCIGRYLLNCNYNNNNNESLFHQEIKLHNIYYNKTYVTIKREIKNYDKNVYIYIYIIIDRFAELDYLYRKDQCMSLLKMVSWLRLGRSCFDRCIYRPWGNQSYFCMSRHYALFCICKFCISSYVSVIFSSCLMIAPQGAWNSE